MVNLLACKAMNGSKVLACVSPVLFQVLGFSCFLSHYMTEIL